MKINFMKTKEMIAGPLAKFSLQHLSDYSGNNLPSWKEYSNSNFLASLSHTI